jgi:hypothetical protein
VPRHSRFALLAAALVLSGGSLATVVALGTAPPAAGIPVIPEAQSVALLLAGLAALAMLARRRG